jgi:hypothetical protein
VSRHEALSTTTQASGITLSSLRLHNKSLPFLLVDGNPILPPSSFPSNSPLCSFHSSTALLHTQCNHICALFFLDMHGSVTPEVLASWPAPNYVDPVTRGNALYIVNSIWLCFATIAVTLRVYTRIWIRNWFGLDDAFVLFALVSHLLSISMAVGGGIWPAFS